MHIDLYHHASLSSYTNKLGLSNKNPAPQNMGSDAINHLSSEKRPGTFHEILVGL